VKGTQFRINADYADYKVHSDTKAAYAVVGLGAGRQIHNGNVSLGAFVDVGIGHYDTFARFPERIYRFERDIRGSGNLNSIGGGLLFRRKWDSGVRWDVMLRGGYLHNDFRSPDLVDDGIALNFKRGSSYWGASMGLAKEWVRGQNTFELNGRYSWLMDSGGNTTLSTKELVRFNTVHSHRLTAGGRYTRSWNSRSAWYVGAAFEQELNGNARAVERVTGLNMVLEGPTLRGRTGVGELGLILRRSDRFQATCGLEGYVGRREGGAGFATLQWRW